jgi:hypothetical protein
MIGGSNRLLYQRSHGHALYARGGQSNIAENIIKKHFNHPNMAGLTVMGHLVRILFLSRDHIPHSREHTDNDS